MLKVLLVLLVAASIVTAQTVINGYTIYPILTGTRGVLVDSNDASIFYVVSYTSYNPFYGAPSTGSTDVYVIKMWTNGTRIWVKLYGGAQTESVSNVGFIQDPANGDLLINGFSSSSQFTTGSTSKTTSPFLMRVNSVNSSMIWATISPIASGQSYTIPSRPMIAGDRIIACSLVNGGAPSNTGPLIIKYFYANGTLDLSGSSVVSFDNNTGVTLLNADYDSASDTIFFYGKATTSFLGQTIVGTQAFYWVRIFASNLTAVSARLLGGSGTMNPVDMILDTSNQFVYVGGSTNVALQAGGSIGTVGLEGSSNEGVIAQYSFNGDLNWVRIFGGSGIEVVFAMRVHPVISDVYLTGYSTSSLYQNYSNNGGNDLIVASYHQNGTRLGFVMLGTSGADIGYGLDITPNGKVVVAGNLNGLGGVYVGDTFQNAATTTTDASTTTTDVTTTTISTGMATTTIDAVTTTTTDAVTTTTDVTTMTTTTDVTTTTISTDAVTTTTDAVTTMTTDVTTTTDVVTTTTDAATTTSSDIVTTTSTVDIATSTTDPLSTSTNQPGAVTSTTVNVPASTFATATSSTGVTVVTVYQAVTATLPAQTVVATHTAVVTSAANGATTQNAESAATGEKIGLSFAFLFVGLALGGLAMFFLSRSNRFKRLFQSNSDSSKVGSTSQFQYQVQDTGRSNNDLEKNLNIPPKNDDQRSIDVFYMADTN